MKLDTIYNGDALEVLKTFPDCSIDMIFTDPPYGHNNNNGDLISQWEAALGRGDYEPERDNIPILNDGQEANDLFKRFLLEANRILKPGACCCCCCGGGGGPDPQLGRWSLWMAETMGFKQAVIWDKGKMGMGWHYRRSYEIVLVGQKKGAACYWFDESKKVENIIRAGEIPKIIPKRTQHPTEKSPLLAKRFILLHSQPGMVVLDPFCGSGSTLEAACELDRRYIGVELAEKYFDMARQRVKTTQKELAI